MEHIFQIGQAVSARADVRMRNGYAERFFRSFTFGQSELTLSEGEENVFLIGNAASPEIPDGAEFEIEITETGAAIAGRDYPSLMRGYLALLQQVEYTVDGQLYFSPKVLAGRYTLRNRMVHFCVFPETSLLDLKKFIRLAAALQFTHVVIEFWGMLRFDCEPMLAWENAFTKDEAREVIAEARALGVEPIPMMNHLGHATACRLASGKHVVLDRDPSLYALFTPDGWSWNVANPRVPALLREVRRELYEVFGEGEYFHAGLDESYMYANDEALYGLLPEFLGDLTREIVSEGRRPMIWMDMFLPPEAYGAERAQVCAKKTPEECRAVLSRLARETVLVDWQYDMKEAPIPTSVYLKDSGFDIMGAPWLNPANGVAHIETAEREALFGVMETTWHTTAKELPWILPFARRFGAVLAPWSPVSGRREELATLLRKLITEEKRYEDCGWRRRQVVLGSEQTV